MTVITHARRKSNLAKMIDAPGGISVQHALQQAKANLEPFREKGLQEVTRQIAILAGLQPPPPEEDQAARLEAVYLAANAIIDAGGPFDLSDVCAAASGLCDLIDAAGPEHPFDWRVPPVFAASLGLLMTLPVAAAAERAKVRQGLDDLIVRKLSQTG